MCLGICGMVTEVVVGSGLSIGALWLRVDETFYLSGLKSICHTVSRCLRESKSVWGVPIIRCLEQSRDETVVSKSLSVKLVVDCGRSFM